MVRTLILSAMALAYMQPSNAQTNNITGQVLVYKTKKNYRDNVPVILSDDKTRIVSYPHPSDLRLGDALLLPTRLRKGYLLDNKGISKNTAFLSVTYKEYAAMKEAPTLKDMYGMILDKDPLESLCDCGDRSTYKDPGKELKKVISKKQLASRCKTIK